MYHRTDQTAHPGTRASEQSGRRPRWTTRSTQLPASFWVTRPASARMGSRDHAVVAGICVSELHEPGTVQLALMVSGVATIQAAQSLGADPTPGELLAVVAERGPSKKHTLKARRFLPPEACFLAHWPSHISASDVFGNPGTDPFGPALGALRSSGAEISDFTGDDSDSINNAVTYLSYMADEDPDTVHSYLTANERELEMYAVPSGATARVLDTGPNNAAGASVGNAVDCKRFHPGYSDGAPSRKKASRFGAENVDDSVRFRVPFGGWFSCPSNVGVVGVVGISNRSMASSADPDILRHCRA